MLGLKRGNLFSKTIIQEIKDKTLGWRQDNLRKVERDNKVQTFLAPVCARGHGKAGTDQPGLGAKRLKSQCDVIKARASSRCGGRIQGPKDEGPAQYLIRYEPVFEFPIYIIYPP